MKHTIGIYTDGDWPGAEALVDELRATGDTTVRIRNGALFTPDQAEAFDRVLVHGDCAAVRAAYADAETVGAAKPGVPAASSNAKKK